MLKRWWKLNGPQRLAWLFLLVLCVAFWTGVVWGLSLLWH